MNRAIFILRYQEQESVRLEKEEEWEMESSLQQLGVQFANS